MIIKLKNNFILISFTNFLFLNAFFSQSSVLEYNFISYLIKNQKYNEAEHYLNNFASISNKDTLFFLKGYNYYLMKNPELAMNYLDSVSENFSRYYIAKMLSSLNSSFISKYHHSIEILNNVSANKLNNEILQYKLLMLAGNYLLLRNTTKFDSISNHFSFDDLKYEIEQKNLVELSKRIKKLKPKSPIVAGLLSTVVPGLGKFYAGNKGSALSDFAANIIFGGMTAEAYYRTKNLNSPQFIIFSSLTLFFYTGNIIGSVHSVKKRWKSINKQINNEILLNMHIPIVRILEK
jgi:hypothetical protein